MTPEPLRVCLRHCVTSKGLRTISPKLAEPEAAPETVQLVAFEPEGYLAERVLCI